MHLTDEDIVRILKLVDETAHDEIEVQWKGVVVRATRRGAGTLRADTPQQTEIPGKSRAERAVPGGCAVVNAPVMGTFYRKPEPGKPPFVEPGSRVSRDDTVCLLEVMKIFTAVKAGHDGIVEAILADEAQLVEFGQPLFAIRPT